jgi:hypothetical protein
MAGRYISVDKGGKDASRANRIRLGMKTSIIVEGATFGKDSPDVKLQ